ncbi:MAG: hypothetical protein KGP28_11875 [Bdellovibrionales bacterium]|nr:hypothetical protein [Bdellovibrionales bacterium]
MNTIQNQNQLVQELADSLRAQKKQKEELQASHEREMENLKQAYSAEKAEATDRFESSVQNDRLQHYENLRKLKNQITREERELETRGREAIAEKNHRLQKEELQTDQEGRKRIETTMKKYAALEEYERQATKQANEEARELRNRSSRQILDAAENGIERLRQEKINFLADKQVNHSDALGEIDKHYQNLRVNEENRYREDLLSLEERGFRELNKKRLEQTRMLSVEAEQKSDPFYQLQRFESSMTDEGPSYRLSVKVPAHERKGLRIQANGQDIHIIGVRVSDREAFEQGRTISTRTHQALSEKINLDTPIDAKTITRMETESGVEFTIPKLGAASRQNDAMSVESDRNNHKIAPNLRFSETLPTPSFVIPKTGTKAGKGTVG